MEIVRLEAKEYAALFPKPEHIFNTPAFTELNRSKCEDIHYLSFHDRKARLGIILGERDGIMRSPFSAPFGGFDTNDLERLEFFDEAAKLLATYAKECGKQIRIVLPPSIYGSSVAKSYSALLRAGAKVSHTDLNYAYELSRFEDYEAHLERSARKNFNQALRNGFQFEILDGNKPSDIARAYAVIRTNRQSKGFPLRMSLEDVLATAPIVSAEFFIQTHDGHDVAAAMVYPVRTDIAQVVYWGDDPAYSGLKSMNYFTYKVFAHYFSRDFHFLDIGPSTEEGIPNYGLCSFKENLGCTVSLKHTLVI